MSKVTENKPLSPLEFLQTFTGAPALEVVNDWKAQAPGARLKIFTSSDAKRIYVLRGITALELATVQSGLPTNLPQEKLFSELQTAIAVRCTLWTNWTKDGKLSMDAIKSSGAGLSQTLHEIIFQLSDFMDPETIERLSADL
jgi:hypothetical protein